MSDGDTLRTDDVAGHRMQLEPPSSSTRKIATVLRVVTTIDTDGVHTATASLQAVHPSMDAGPAGGWILVKCGAAVLAQVHVIDGRAVVCWTLPEGGPRGVTLTYTGDQVFAPTVRSLSL
jgi:hypothetical protein